MRIIISGGGTGGHIFPALSIANALKKIDKNIEILFVGAEGKMEMEKVPSAGYKIIGLPVRGLQRRLTFENIKVVINLIKSIFKANKIIKSFAPDVVVGVGGYASAPIGRAATNKGVPLLLQEQNSYAGVTNKILGQKASCICVAYEGMEKFFPKEKIILTGNPVRKDLFSASKEEAIEFYNLNQGKKTILVTGGSLGAGSLNNAVINSLEYFSSLKDVQVLWQCGSYYYKSLSEKLTLPSNVKMRAFLERMDLAYELSDIVIARAGAGTISELCLLSKASILVPSPNVAEDHQTQNALALVNKNAALMIKDSEVVATLASVVASTIVNDELLLSLQTNIKRMAFNDSDDVIASKIIELAKNNKTGNVK